VAMEPEPPKHGTAGRPSQAGNYQGFVFENGHILIVCLSITVLTYRHLDDWFSILHSTIKYNSRKNQVLKYTRVLLVETCVWFHQIKVPSVGIVQQFAHLNPFCITIAKYQHTVIGAINI